MLFTTQLDCSKVHWSKRKSCSLHGLWNRLWATVKMTAIKEEKVQKKLYVSHSRVLLSKWELYPICFMGKKGLLSISFRHKQVVASAGFTIFLRRWHLSLNHSVISTWVWAVAQRILPERTWAHTSKMLRECPNCYGKGNLESMLLILPQWTSSIF